MLEKIVTEIKWHLTERPVSKLVKAVKKGKISEGDIKYIISSIESYIYRTFKADKVMEKLVITYKELEQQGYDVSPIKKVLWGVTHQCITVGYKWEVYNSKPFYRALRILAKELPKVGTELLGKYFEKGYMRNVEKLEALIKDLSKIGFSDEQIKKWLESSVKYFEKKNDTWIAQSIKEHFSQYFSE